MGKPHGITHSLSGAIEYAETTRAELIDEKDVEIGTESTHRT